MIPTIIPPSTEPLFEGLKHYDKNKNEYWKSRELAKALEYADYRNFLLVIEKAKDACNNSGHSILDHFVEINEMIEIGKGGKRSIESIILSRYACYLIVQNADPSKEVVALGQTYFATQTRLQEIQQSKKYDELTTEDARRVFLREEMRKHNQQLADAAKDAGVIEPLDYAIFQNHGYMGLYGGLGQKEIHAKKGLKKSQKILDHMGSEELAANLFRATQAEGKLRREQIKGKMAANQLHYQVGAKVRATIKELGGTMPEKLPSTDSITKATKRNQLQQNNCSKTENISDDNNSVVFTYEGIDTDNTGYSITHYSALFDVKLYDFYIGAAGEYAILDENGNEVSDRIHTTIYEALKKINPKLKL